MALGLRPAASPLIIPMGLSQHGDAVTLSNRLADPILAGGERPPAAEAGRRLAALLRGRPRVTLAVVHAWSAHALLFKTWLSAAGIDPQADVDWTIVPPADTAAAIESGRIDGFCAGAPWGRWPRPPASAAPWRCRPRSCRAIRKSASPCARPGPRRTPPPCKACCAP